MSEEKAAALKRLHDRAVLDGALRDRSDETQAQLVVAARDAGATWREVGEALGVTRQAATTRFGDKVNKERV